MANLKKILVAYDGSSHSKAALGWAMLLGNYDNAELDVIKVFEPNDPPPAAFTAPRVEQYAEIEEEEKKYGPMQATGITNVTTEDDPADDEDPKKGTDDE